MTVSHRPAGAAHAEHDPLVVADAADRGGHLPASLVDCPDCRALHADLVALVAAIPTAARPARPRDYRLTPADAARLRSTGWRRWLTAIGTSRDTITRPLAIGFTTLGLAGLLVATVPSVLPAGDAGANAPAAGARDAASPPMTGGAEILEAPVSALPSTTNLDQAQASASMEPDVAGGSSGDVLREAPVADGEGALDDGVPPLAVLSGSLLVAGLGLFVLRRRAFVPRRS